MQNLHSLSLNDIAPPNIAADSTVSSLITAIDPQLQQVSTSSIEPLILARIDELPEPVIDLLAWQLHVDFYDLAGTLTMKREAVKGSILWHMHKGTQWAIIEALRMIDISAEFVHWHDSGGDPYTFKLRAIVGGEYYRTQGREQLVSAIRRAVDESKAARSYMSELETIIYFHEDIALYTGVIPFLSGTRRILLDRPTLPDESTLYEAICSALQGHQVLRYYYEDEIDAKLYAAGVMLENRDLSLGLEEELLQELLRQFERRIFERIDASEARTTALIEASRAETNGRLDEILDLLRWTGAEE